MTVEIPDSVMEAAVAWFDDLRSEPPVDRAAFADWLMRSPTHVEAFLTISTLHGGLSAARDADRAWLTSLIQQTSSNVVPLDERQPDESPASASSGKPSAADQATRRWSWAAAAAVVLGAMVYWVTAVDPTGPDAASTQYITAIGEQHATVLEDGSVMQLNTDSQVQVRYSAEARDIVLTRGEALFDVRKDPERPFRVNSGDVWVEAIGTRFNVHRRGDGTVVTVIEGQVAVEPTSATPSGSNEPPVIEETLTRVELAAGEQLAMTGGSQAADVPVPVDTQRTTAWTQRRVVFDDDPLADVIAEFNRYNRTKLVIVDAALLERRISGVFKVDDPYAFSEVLASMAPVEAIDTGDQRLVITPLPARSAD